LSVTFLVLKQLKSSASRQHIPDITPSFWAMYVNSDWALASWCILPISRI